ncbi:MAG: ABC transporter permease [bacterium]|nr:ABC transporter permease [bacterium]
MWKNYLLTSVRAFKKDKFFISVNVFSLGIAFSLCIIGYFNFEFNNSFNQYFDDANELYKINAVRDIDSDNKLMGITPVTLKNHLDQIPNSQSSRFHRNSVTLKIGDNLFQENIGFVDQEYLQMFSFNFLHGKAFNSNGSQSIVIDDETALKLFDRTNIIGEVITLLLPGNNEVSYQISGVIEKAPRNTSFYFSMLAPFENYEKYYHVDGTSWDQWIDGTFIKTSESISSIKQQLNSKLKIQNSKNKDLLVESYRIDSILDWPAFENQQYKGHFMGYLHPASVLGTISSAITILLLACFNYINTSIAISGKRLKEIGIRKIIGGHRKTIIIQFMVENTLMVLIALLISVGVSYFIIPYYNAMFDIQLVDFNMVDLTNLILFGVAVFTLVAFLSSAYPAFYISKFDSLEILKNKVRFSGKNLLFKGLLAFQFIVCFYNVFALLVFIENGEYQKNLDRGYSISNTVNIPLNSPEQFDILANELSKNPGITSISGTQDVVGFHTTDVAVTYASNEIQASQLRTGMDYIENIGVRLQQGQYLDKQHKDNQHNILINNMLNEELGGDMLNKTLIVNGQQSTVIGLVDDFNLKPIMLTNKIRPTIIQLVAESDYQYATVISTSQNSDQLMGTLQEVWYSQFPNQLYRGYKQEKVLKALSQTNNIILNINVFIAVVAVMITILGLYTLISLTIQKRIKEFGIRKVLGASSGSILKLINNQLIWVVGVSGIIGLVLGNFVIGNLLDIIYAYHMEIGWVNFVAPTILMLAIVIVSVAQKSISTAKLNPTTQLRME